MSKFYKPKVIMSIHGWGSRGIWQSEFAEAAEELGFIPLKFKYGFTLRFDQLKVNRLIIRFRQWYFKMISDPHYGLNIDQPFHRPSIVAHSMGSWIVAKALVKYSDIKFDKIFLHGAIVPTSFDWYSLILKDQVHLIITETSRKDQFVRFGTLITGKLLTCCRNRFRQQSRFIKYEEVPAFGHSDFQFKERFKSQFKRYLKLTPTQLNIVHGRDLNMKQLKKYFKTTSKIDSDSYGSLYDANAISTSDAFKWAEIEQDIWSFLTNVYTGEVVGYINVLPVSQDAFESFIHGYLSENQIRSENVVPFDDRKDMNVIIMSIAIKKQVIESAGGIIPTQHGEILQMALAQKLVDKTRNTVKLRRVASIAWTPSGLRLSERFGLSKNGIEYLGHPVYVGEIKKMKKFVDKKVGAIPSWFIYKVNKK